MIPYIAPKDLFAVGLLLEDTSYMSTSNKTVELEQVERSEMINVTHDVITAELAPEFASKRSEIFVGHVFAMFGKMVRVTSITMELDGTLSAKFEEI